MPRKPGRVPAYCRHKASGNAVVRLDGRDHYLGPYGCLESHERYARVIAAWHESEYPRSLDIPKPNGAADSDVLTINEFILRYLRFAETYYVKNGKPTQEFEEMKYCLRPLRLLYGRTPARNFGPLALKAVRQHMIDVDDLSRGVVNHRVNRVKRAFKWAVSEELAPPERTRHCGRSPVCDTDAQRPAKPSRSVRCHRLGLTQCSPLCRRRFPQ